MMILNTLFNIATCTATVLASFSSRTNPHAIAAKRAAAIERFSESMSRDKNGFMKRAAAPGEKNITFSNPKASQFYVDGASLPQVEFDIGPSWAGLLPISGNANETRKLFFWFFPPGPQGSLDDLIFW
jgi:carboxypeptidase D